MQQTPYDESKEGVIRAPDYVPQLHLLAESPAMGNSQRPLLPEVGWDNTIDTDFKKLSVGPVKGGRPPFFFVGRNQGFAHFFGFICFIY